jgi:NADPH-dependent ferric siderophore reductase
MAEAQIPNRAAAKPPGGLDRTLLRLLMRRATVVGVERPAEGFRLITLEGRALRGVAWAPGQKIQVAMGSAFVARTYTPIEWDAAAGRTRILGYAHGDGPGSAWVRGVEPGDDCDLFGPRASLDTAGAAAPLAVFGDETSIGLAHALSLRNGAGAMACCFEVGDAEGAGQAAARLGLDGARLVARRPDDVHLEEMEAALAAPLAAGASFVLTGKAGTIQRLRHGLKQRGAPTERIFTKAYWAPGKKGLD